MPRAKPGRQRRVINPTDYKPEVVEHLYQPWTIELKPYSDGGYFARVVELQGCMAEGADKMEALHQLEEAQAQWLASAVENDDPIPQPLGHTEYSGKIFVRTSPQLHRMVAEAALREGVSMSQWAAEVLARAVSLQDLRPWFTQGTWKDMFQGVTDSLSKIESHVTVLSAGPTGSTARRSGGDPDPSSSAGEGRLAMAGKRGRSASTGRYVKQSTVRRNPKTTVNETVKPRKSGGKRKKSK